MTLALILTISTASTAAANSTSTPQNAKRVETARKAGAAA